MPAIFVVARIVLHLCFPCFHSRYLWQGSPAKMCKHSVPPSLRYSAGASSKWTATSLAALPALVVGIGPGLKVWLSVALTVRQMWNETRRQRRNDPKHWSILIKAFWISCCSLLWSLVGILQLEDGAPPSQLVSVGCSPTATSHPELPAHGSAHSPSCDCSHLWGTCDDHGALYQWIIISGYHWQFWSSCGQFTWLLETACMNVLLECVKHVWIGLSNSSSLSLDSNDD